MDVAMLLINLMRNPGPRSLRCRTSETYKQHFHFLVAFASDAQQCCGRLCTSLRWANRRLEQRNVINLTSNPLKANIKSSWRSCSEPVTTSRFCALKQYLFATLLLIRKTQQQEQSLLGKQVQTQTGTRLEKQVSKNCFLESFISYRVEYYFQQGKAKYFYTKIYRFLSDTQVN